jgi:hypothetical protein
MQFALLYCPFIVPQLCIDLGQAVMGRRRVRIQLDGLLQKLCSIFQLAFQFQVLVQFEVGRPKTWRR